MVNGDVTFVAPSRRTLIRHIVNCCEIDSTPHLGKTPAECPVLIPTVTSKQESARVEDPDFIALSKAQADVKFMVYMNGIGR